MIATPVAVAVGTPSPSPPPVRRDPCGGAQEQLKKYLAASPCVFVAGQANVQTTYASTNIPANLTLDVSGPNAYASASRSALGYPAAILNLGITSNAQLTILPPSFSQIGSTSRGLLAAGATDMQLWYKQLVYVDSARGVLGGILLTYEAPTGSPGLAAPGPAYTVNPLLNVATNRARSMGVSLAFPVTSTATAPGQRGWSFVPQAVPYWRSPGGTLLALVVAHDFTNDTTSLLINSAQLLTRQFQLQATYGGVNSPVDLANPLQGVTRATGTAYSRTVTFGFGYMLGTSEQ